jgi:hypothetical protein
MLENIIIIIIIIIIIDWMIGVRIRRGLGIFLFGTASTTGSGAHLASYPMGQGLFP